MENEKNSKFSLNNMAYLQEIEKNPTIPSNFMENCNWGLKYTLKGCKEIHPYVHRDIGPLGPLRCSHFTSSANHSKQGIGNQWPCAILGWLVIDSSILGWKSDAQLSGLFLCVGELLLRLLSHPSRKHLHHFPIFPWKHQLCPRWSSGQPLRSFLSPLPAGHTWALDKRTWVMILSLYDSIPRFGWSVGRWVGHFILQSVGYAFFGVYKPFDSTVPV